MINITNKPVSLRTAVAQAIVRVGNESTIAAIDRKQVPKGDIFEASRVAALLAVKKTSELIPDCHPLPIEYCNVAHTVKGLEICTEVEVHAIYRTGVEMEALHGASVASLTIYDMLKPIDIGLEIKSIKLLRKTGGRSQHRYIATDRIKTAVIVCSDTVSAGSNEDVSGRLISSRLESLNVSVENVSVIPDEVEKIRDTVKQFCGTGCDLVIITGGTGLSPRDVTPEAIKPLLDKEAPGIAEAIRKHGQDRTPFSMLSRSIAGVSGRTLIISLPGSASSVQESLDVLFPFILHAIDIMRGAFH